MTITTRIITDSITPEGKRVTTFQIRYPRFIHAELMTHRVFSRNASSSRAIPIKTVVKDIRNDTAMPIHWGAHQPGMQANNELTGVKKFAMKALWKGSMYLMTGVASLAFRLGAHKQIVNRLIEPWSHINVVVTSTEWSNFYALRCHRDAQPEIKALAESMREDHTHSKPTKLTDGQWHLPYITSEDWYEAEDWLDTNTLTNTLTFFDGDDLLELLIRVSVARCARTSYNLHDGSPSTIEKDLGLYDRLVGSVPLHASPAEHQAGYYEYQLGFGKSGNLQGVIQYRKLLPGENQ